MAAFDPNSNEITTDPEYLLQNPGYVKQAHDLLVKYGILPPAGSGWGADAATQAEVDANPYSVAKLLGKSYQTALGSNMNTANSHGALFSGAYVNNQAHSLDDYQHGMSDAGTGLMGGLDAVGNQRTGTLVDIWKRLSSQPVDPDITPPPPGPPSLPNVPGASGVGQSAPTPQGPYIRTGPEAGSKSKPKPVAHIGLGY